MNQSDAQTALNVLINIRGKLIESLVEEVLRHQDDDHSSFSLQEIEDRFAIRVANLNTLIATLQEQLGQYEEVPTRIIVDIEETNRQRLDSRLNEILEFISPDELLHMSVIPAENGKFLIVLARSQ